MDKKVSEKEVLLSDGRRLVFTGLREGGKEGGVGNSWVVVHFISEPPLFNEGRNLLDPFSDLAGEIEDAGINFIVDNTGQDGFKTYFLNRSLTSEKELTFQRELDSSCFGIPLYLGLGDIELTMAEYIIIVKYELRGFKGLILSFVIKNSPLWNQLNRTIKRYLISKGYQAELYNLEGISVGHFYLDKSFLAKKDKNLVL